MGIGKKRALLAVIVAVIIAFVIFMIMPRRDIGLVYEIDPLATPRLKKVRLKYLDNSGYLKGKYADVYLATEPDDIYNLRRDSVHRPAAKHDAFSKKGNFCFRHDKDKQCQVNAYYHLNRMHDYFSENLGHHIEYPITCYVLDKSLRSPAMYVHLYWAIRFGNWDNGVNLALSSRSIYHEYTHAVLQSIYCLDTEKEAFAICEAYADYFSASIRNSPSSSGYVNAYSRDGWLDEQRGFPWDRMFKLAEWHGLKNNKRYPEDMVFVEEHSDSEILSGAFWDIREALGQETADKIIFEAYKRIPVLKDKYNVYNFPSFSIIREAVVLADKDLFESGNKDVIDRIFDARGIPDWFYDYRFENAFGRGIVIGAYLKSGEVLIRMMWIGVYRIGEGQRLFGKMPVWIQSARLRLYTQDGQIVEGFRAEAEIKPGKEEGFNPFLVEFRIPENLSPGQYSFQFDIVEAETNINSKSNAVPIILVERMEKKGL